MKYSKNDKDSLNFQKKQPFCFGHFFSENFVSDKKKFTSEEANMG